MILKKLFFVVLSAVAIFSFDIQAASEKTKVLYPENNCGTADGSDRFSVVGFKNYPPFSWVELDLSDTAKTSYNYKGFIFDSVKTSLNDMKIQKINNLVMDSVQQIQKAVLHGKTDMFFMSYYVDEAKSGADYIYPAYFGNPFVVVSRASKKIEVDDISGLKGLKGVIRREEEIEALISGLLPTDTKMEVVDGAETAFRKLLSGDVDFMITSPYAAEAEVRRFKIKNKVHFGKKVLSLFPNCPSAENTRMLLHNNSRSRLKIKARWKRNCRTVSGCGRINSPTIRLCSIRRRKGND